MNWRISVAVLISPLPFLRTLQLILDKVWSFQKLKKNVLQSYFSNLLYIKRSVINFYTTAFLQTPSVTKHMRNPSTQYQVSSTTDWIVLLPSVIYAHLFIEQMHKCSTDLLFCLRPVSPSFPLHKLGEYRPSGSHNRTPVFAVLEVCQVLDSFSLLQFSFLTYSAREVST